MTPDPFESKIIFPFVFVASIVFALIVKLSTDNVVNVPTLVIAVCAAPVTVAAVPDVFWLPAVLTPGKSMFAVPSNDTPPIVLAVAKAVDVADNATAIFAVPSKDVPPIVLAVANAVAVAALPVVLPELPDIDGAVIAPVVTAPDVVNVLEPMLMFPNPDVIEPVSNAPVVTNDVLPAVGDLPDKSVVKFAIFDCAIAADALILASAILVIELPVPSWSIVLFVNVVVELAVTRPVSSAD